jgi:2,4-dienoyl-CoA reductase-like NADH-dependent reductase (Old Yellow Enzyme family)
VHCGTVREVGASPNPDLAPLSPSGLYLPFESFGDKPAVRQVAEPASVKDIDAAIDGFARSARYAKALGFDGVQLHGAHGYLIDQFFWDKMNRRQDAYGGSLVDRTRFATEVIRAVREAVGEDYPVFFRWSQWKQQDYWAKLCQTPAELEDFLTPLSEAGVDIFDCSTRRVWEPEFDGSPLNVAGWTRRITGKPTVTVGSISLDHDPLPSKEVGDRPAERQLHGRCPRSIQHVVGMLGRGECDLVAVGRAMITNPDWTRDLRDRRWDKLGNYSADALARLH